MVHQMNFTQIVVILFLVIAFIGYIIYFLYKNKEKIKNINIQKWIKEKKTNSPKCLKRKNIFIFLGVTVTIVIIISTYIWITSHIKEQQRIEKYNNDLSICYEVIKNDSDFTKFTSIIAEHTEETDFSSEAYKMLYKAIDEELKILKMEMMMKN